MWLNRNAQALCKPLRPHGVAAGANLYNQALHQRLRPVLPAHRVPAVVLVHHERHVEEV